MEKKVSLKEIVGTKIVYAIFLALYYWMWSRSDWADYYQTIQRVLGGFLISFLVFQIYRIRKYKKECVDEMAEQNLKRCDSICLKIFIAVMVVVAWIGGILGHVNAIGTEQIGWEIILSILAISIIRTILFIIMDSKGV
ncbi:MAG TPA: hypothetical protein VJ083_01460 [Sedimentibacter sp.]|nr:hypothetical protein [Sedimentibacter sp.]